MPFGDTPAFDRGIDRGFMMPVGELITSALSNKGNPTGILQDNTFRVQNAQEVRIVDKNGEVLFSGVGPDAARQAVAVGQNLSDTLGNKAGWTIQTGEQTINADGSVGPMRYFDVANEKVNKNILGKIADIALPVAASFIPGVGPVLGAALGSTASSVAQGRSIGDTLMRAGLSAGGAAAGGAILGKAAGGSGATVGSNLPSYAAMLPTEAFGSVAGSTAGSTAGGLIDDIIVTALNRATPSVLGPAVTGGISNTLLDQVISQPSPVSQPTPAEPAPATYTPPPEEIVATAIRQPVSTSVSNIFPAVTGGISNTLLDQVINQPAQVQEQITEQPLEAGPEIVATAPTGAEIPFVPPLIPDVAPLEKFTPIQEILKDVPMGPEKQSLLDRLTANMGLTDYLTAASLLGSAFGGGGGGGAATAVPYVSPFGSGGLGLGAGQDMRVNPNISDYERYGFGPEASFFAPGYSQLVSSGANAPTAPTTMGPQAAMLNPQYVPLI